MTHSWVGRGPHSWVESGTHVWAPIGGDDLRGEELEVCAFAWMKLCPIEADGRFVMRAADDLSLGASQGGDSDSGNLKHAPLDSSEACRDLEESRSDSMQRSVGECSLRLCISGASR